MYAEHYITAFLFIHMAEVIRLYAVLDFYKISRKKTQGNFVIVLVCKHNKLGHILQ